MEVIHGPREFDPPIPATPQPANPGPAPSAQQPIVPAGLGAMLRRRRVQPAHLGIAVIAIGAIAAIFAWTRSGEPPAESTPPAAAAAPAPAPQAAPAPPAVAGVELELTTLRRVWLRVVVDGQKTIEREIEPGQRIPVTANQSIVVRAGDAGALRVSTGGREEIFGTEGQPATRSFTRPR